MGIELTVGDKTDGPIQRPRPSEEPDVLLRPACPKLSPRAHCPLSGTRGLFLAWVSLWLMGLSLSLHVELPSWLLLARRLLFCTLQFPPGDISATALDSLLCFPCVIFGRLSSPPFLTCGHFGLQLPAPQVESFTSQPYLLDIPLSAAL